jgi:phosphatidylserine/phosphatidylglycerophosphate/cardiolipin synthase-like enzyme
MKLRQTATILIALGICTQALAVNLLGGAKSQPSAPQSLDAKSSIEVGFSPGNAEALVLREIAAARQSIDMAAYSFTSPTIAKALVDAHKRGVQVRAVLDKSQLSERYSGRRSWPTRACRCALTPATPSCTTSFW